jgi:dihydrofolate synthase/folylpolyglutamate synthase
MPRAPIPAPRSEATLARLTGLHPKLIDLSLGRVERLLAALGHPEKRLPPVVHVAGTNGKGSSIAFVKAIAEAAGLRVHVYTSPHLVRFNERIAIAGEIIADEALADILEECEAANDGAPITFFEVTTAAAFVAFAREAADLALIETGLGGRFDATNVIAQPALTAITPVSIDHIGFLGDTIAAIAGEKAGILKPGIDCVVAPQHADAADVIAARAREVGAKLVRHDRDWRLDGMTYADDRGAIALPTPGLIGRHQVENAALAAACVRRLAAFDIADGDIVEGVRRATWPARLQRLTGGRLVDSVPGNCELWLDGGHNPAAAAALADVLTGWRDEPVDLPVDLVVGMLRTRDPAPYLAPLAPLVRRARTVAVPGEEASLTADELARAARDAGIDAEPADNVGAAVRALAARSGGRSAKRSGGRILICGSLYLAGSVLADG